MMNCPVKDETYLCETPCMVDKCPYQQGARDFAEWLVNKGVLGNRVIYNGEITDYGKVYLAEWQKGTEE